MVVAGCRVTSILDNTTQGRILDHIDAKGGQACVWPMYICIYKVTIIIASRLAVVCTFYNLIPERLGRGGSMELRSRDPSYFKRAGKRRTEGLMRKFRRC